MSTYRPIGFVQQPNANTEKYIVALRRFFNLRGGAK